MDQRIESFLTDVLASRAKTRTRSAKGCASPSPTVRRALPSAGAEQAHEGQGSARLPRAVPLSRPRGMHQRRGSRLAEHLMLVLSIIDRQGRVEP
jgi:hypothetical protein